MVPNLGIEVDAQAVWCPKHRRALDLDPSRRFDLACVRMFDYAVRDPRVQIECGFNPSTGTRADPVKLTAVLRAHSPLCCYLPGEVFEKVLREAYPGLFEMAQRHMLHTEELKGAYGGRQ